MTTRKKTCGWNKSKGLTGDRTWERKITRATLHPTGALLTQHSQRGNNRGLGSEPTPRGAVVLARVVGAHRRKRQVLRGTFNEDLVTDDTVPSKPAGVEMKKTRILMPRITQYNTKTTQFVNSTVIKINQALNSCDKTG